MSGHHLLSETHVSILPHRAERKQTVDSIRIYLPEFHQSDVTLSQDFKPVRAQLSLKAAKLRCHWLKGLRQCKICVILRLCKAGWCRFHSNYQFLNRYAMLTWNAIIVFKHPSSATSVQSMPFYPCCLFWWLAFRYFLLLFTQSSYSGTAHSCIKCGSGFGYPCGAWCRGLTPLAPCMVVDNRKQISIPSSRCG